jgi:hypothetical protein
MRMTDEAIVESRTRWRRRDQQVSLLAISTQRT